MLYYYLRESTKNETGLQYATKSPSMVESKGISPSSKKIHQVGHILENLRQIEDTKLSESSSIRTINNEEAHARSFSKFTITQMPASRLKSQKGQSPSNYDNTQTIEEQDQDTSMSDGKCNIIDRIAEQSREGIRLIET